MVQVGGQKQDQSVSYKSVTLRINLRRAVTSTPK